MPLPESCETGTGFSQPRVHTVMGRRSAREHNFLPITVVGKLWVSNSLEEAFSGISLIKWQFETTWEYFNLIVLMAKEETTGDITCRFIFLTRKTKNLLVKNFVKMNVLKVYFFTCRLFVFICKRTCFLSPCAFLMKLLRMWIHSKMGTI